MIDIQKDIIQHYSTLTEIHKSLSKPAYEVNKNNYEEPKTWRKERECNIPIKVMKTTPTDSKVDVTFSNNNIDLSTEAVDYSNGNVKTKSRYYSSTSFQSKDNLKETTQRKDNYKEEKTVLA
jgi:hypothetical protein